MNRREKKWEVTSSEAEEFVIARSGFFKAVGDPDPGTHFVDPYINDVAFARLLDDRSSVGDTGVGWSSEMECSFTWILRRK